MAAFKCARCSYSRLVDDKHIGRLARCPKCGKFDPIVAALDSFDEVYFKAKRVSEGMHRFHKYGKFTAYALTGFAIWGNDLADRFVQYLCDWVDWVTSVSPIYKVYNLTMSGFALIGIAWVSRWFYWTMLMMMLETDRLHYRSRIARLAAGICFIWCVEYLFSGFVMRAVFSGVVPFSIPLFPSAFAIMVMAVSFATVYWYELRNPGTVS